MRSASASPEICGELTKVPQTMRFRSPSCARWPAPSVLPSPSPTGCTEVTPRGSPSARKRAPSAAISASGTACPPPDPAIRMVSPERTRATACSAVTRFMKDPACRLELSGKMAGRELARCVLDERRHDLGADALRDRAAGAEAAAGGRVDGARRLALELEVAAPAL